MKTRRLLLLFVLILTSFSHAQNTYSYHVYDGNYVSVQDDISKDDIENDLLVMRWQDYHNDKEENKIYIDFNESDLGFLSSSTVVAAWQRAKGTWNSSTVDPDAYPFYETTSSVSVPISVSSAKDDFNDPESDAATTPKAFGWDGTYHGILKETNDPLTTIPDTYDATEIIFNNTSEFKVDHDWVDDVGAELGDDYTNDEIDVESIALHELGHLLGLIHIQDASTVMFSNYLGGRRELTNADREAFGNLYLQDFVTPIGPCESGVSIASNPSVLKENQTHIFESTVNCTDDWVSEWKWEIKLWHTGGAYILASNNNGSGDGSLEAGDDGNLLTSSKWTVEIPELPNGYEWYLWDNNGYIQTEISCVGIGGNFPTDEDNIMISTDFLSAPLNFAGSSQNNHPKLTWDENIEPDFSNYEVWKKVNTGGYSLLTTTTNTYFVDTDEDIISQPESNDKDVFYKIRAADNTGKKSLYTSPVQYLVSGDPLWSRDGSKNFQALKLDDFALETNHPNPFNPTTQISYALPEASVVTLEVFDVSGRKVSVLVKKSQEQGWHYATFDGGTLPSGIYIYRISATGMESGKRFTQAKRMLLVK